MTLIYMIMQLIIPTPIVVIKDNAIFKGKCHFHLFNATDCCMSSVHKIQAIADVSFSN